MKFSLCRPTPGLLRCIVYFKVKRGKLHTHRFNMFSFIFRRGFGSSCSELSRGISLKKARCAEKLIHRAKNKNTASELGFGPPSYTAATMTPRNNFDGILTLPFSLTYFILDSSVKDQKSYKCYKYYTSIYISAISAATLTAYWIHII